VEKEVEQEITHECPKCGHKWVTVEIFVVEIDWDDFDHEPIRDESRD
jgi:hypothetical protein